MRTGIASTPLLAGIALLLGTAGGAAIASQHRSVPPTDAVTTHGEWVKYANAKGDSVRAYIAYPERQGKAPAIIVIHEIFGATDWEPTVADSFAKKGYVAIVPDLLSSRYGITPPATDSGRKLIATLTPDGIVADLDATYRYVTTRPATRADRVGAIGFCWGGGTVWRYAAANPKLSAAVVCYGPLADTTMLHQVKAPVLGVYGMNDGRINNQLPEVVRIMTALKKPFALDSYPETGHGFFKPGRNGFGTAGMAKAQRDVDAFFAKHLEGK